VQRTEVVLRVNAPTNDVASQTEMPEELVAERRYRDEEPESLAKPRKKLQEEIECEELSRDLANQLGPNDKLLPILGKCTSYEQILIQIAITSYIYIHIKKNKLIIPFDVMLDVCPSAWNSFS
jgi:hypothetical protein